MCVRESVCAVLKVLITFITELFYVRPLQGLLKGKMRCAD